METRQQYNTKAKKYILEYLSSNSDTTVAVSDICAYLSENGISVNNTTVYRCLNRLEKEEKIIKFSSENGTGSVYQLIGHSHSCDEHIHIQCVKCGKLIHLDCHFMNDLKNHLSQNHGFSLKCSGSILYGICNGCDTNKT